MPNSSDRPDQRPSGSAPSEELQPAIDAASGDPRSGEEPEEQRRSGRGQREGVSDMAADAHTAPADQPSQDNTDRRA